VVYFEEQEYENNKTKKDSVFLEERIIYFLNSRDFYKPVVKGS
jgi:hypothetical protein